MIILIYSHDSMIFHGQNRLSSRKPRTLHWFHGHSLSKVVLAKILRMISETQQLFHTSAEANPLQSSSNSFEDLNSQVLEFSFSQRGPQACECCTSAKHHLLVFQMLQWTSEICVKLQVHSNLPMSTNCFKWGHAQQMLPWPFSEPRRGLESLRFEKAQTNEVKNAIQESWYHIENHRNIWSLLYSVYMSIRDSGFEASKLFVLMTLKQVPVIADAFCISASLGHKSQKCETLKLRTRSICCDSRPLYPWADRCWFVLESFQVLFVLPHDRSKDLYKSMAGRFCPFQSISFGSIDASLWQDANAGHVVKICEIHFNRGRFSRKGQAGHLNGIFQDADALITLFLTDLIEQGSHWTNLNKQFISEATIARPQPCNFWKSKCSLKSAAKWTKQMQQIQVFRSNQMGQVNVTQLTSAGYISQKPSYWWPLVLITVTLPTLQNSCKLTVSKINVSAPGS